jgi:DNA-binding NarL/FixJ family response regulator
MASDGDRCGAILVADDDAAARELIVSLLVGAGYEAEAFASATACLARAESARPRLAILDVCMPQVSGWEACRRLRAMYGTAVPVLFVSGERVDPVDRTAGLLLGGDDYLTKPFSPDELVARVLSLLRRAPAAETDVRLTAREEGVLELLADGLSRREIARTLVISPKTVSAHLGHVYEKLGARDRVQAINAARRRGLIAGDNRLISS